jgi:iron(III) transport system substrate-binding protein
MRKWFIAFTILAVALAGAASSQEQVIVYSSFHDEFIQAWARPFTEATGIPVLNIVVSSGESHSRLRAEAQRPQANFWLSVRPAILEQAYEEGLTEAWVPENAENILPVFQYEEPYITAVGYYPLVVFYNPTALQRAGLEPPTPDWESLTDPAYRGQIVMPHPATSGTAYALITTNLQRFIQAGGTEEDGWEYLSRLYENVAQFTRSGRAPQSMVAQGEYAIGIGFYDAVWQFQQEGFPIEVLVPEPTFSEPYGAAIVAGGPHQEAAQQFFEFLLSPEGQAVLTDFGNAPVVAGAEALEGGVTVDPDQVVHVDHSWAAEHRDRLLGEFQQVTGAEPQ